MTLLDTKQCTFRSLSWMRLRPTAAGLLIAVVVLAGCSDDVHLENQARPYDRMLSVTVGPFGLVAVGEEHSPGDAGAVWND